MLMNWYKDITGLEVFQDQMINAEGILMYKIRIVQEEPQSISLHFWDFGYELYSSLEMLLSNSDSIQWDD